MKDLSLKEWMTWVTSNIYPEGSYLETTDASFDPNEKLGGIWDLEPVLEDELIDSGASGIWQYRRWKSGIAECWGTWSGTLSNYATWNNMYSYYTSVAFPSGLFVAPPTIAYGARVGNGFALAGTQTPSLSASATNVYACASSSGSQSVQFFINAKGKWTTTVYRPNARFRWRKGLYNILRGTKAPTMGTGTWGDATWRTSGTGTSITTETISDSPVTGVTKAFKLVSSTGAEWGFAQDYYFMTRHVGKPMTFSVWLKGPVGTEVRIQPYWTNTTGEAESWSETITLDTNGWKKYTTTSPAIQYNHKGISIGYIYVISQNTTMYACAPMLEWGTETHDWKPSLYGD